MQRIPTSAGELRLSAVLQLGHFDGPLRAREARKNEKALTNQGLGVDFGGDEGDRTLDLRIANATLSQLSYVPTRGAIIADPAVTRQTPAPGRRGVARAAPERCTDRHTRRDGARTGEAIAKSPPAVPAGIRHDLAQHGPGTPVLA